MTKSLEAWFAAEARVLPWRSKKRDPYRSMVSEAMLQQTQVSRVLEKFDGFMKRFPTVRMLAKADEADVLAAWSGLGYYRRARHLHAAAKAVVAQHRGVVPCDVETLRALPGVGRYTAGAIASIVFGAREPIVDGNVRRVLLRVEGQDLDGKDAETWAWARAEQLVVRCEDPALFNEGLMELGALVCSPKAPRCGECPWRSSCVARREGRENQIPSPKKRTVTREVHHGVVVVRDGAGRLLLERRPERGMWAGMWQAPTLEQEQGEPGEALLRSHAGVRAVAFRERFAHQTTHRMVHFHVWEAVSRSKRPSEGRRWVDALEAATLALANPHRRILLGNDCAKPARRRLE